MFLSFPASMYCSTLKGRRIVVSYVSLNQKTVNETKGKRKLHKSRISHLFTSSAFVFNPFPGSPLHRNQNLSSSFFNSLGFRPASEAPGISSSVKTDTFVEVDGIAAMIIIAQGLSSLALMFIVTIPPECPPFMKVVYS